MNDQQIESEIQAKGLTAPRVSHMTFGGALVALKAGQRIRRAGWNGKDMWLRLVNAAEYDISPGLLDHRSENPVHLTCCRGSA